MIPVSHKTTWYLQNYKNKNTKQTRWIGAIVLNNTN